MKSTDEVMKSIWSMSASDEFDFHQNCQEVGECDDKPNRKVVQVLIS